MFFILSKILAFLIAPYTWLFFGLILLLKKLWHTPYKKWVLGLSIFMYVISNSFIVDEVVRAWEYCDDDIYLKDTKYDLAIVLGGMGRIDERQDRFDFNDNGDRLFQTLELYHKKRVQKLLITGGSGSISKPHHREAIYIKKYLKNIAIPDSNIIIENNSKNTYENAIFTKAILDSLQFKGSILLVTSSFHMSRSLAIFNKAGYKNVTPYVTNKISGLRKFEFDHCFIPNIEAVYHINLILHEMIGYVTYKIKGYL
ncbi:MAG: YdcF family protein [Bacteroidia bacterium]|nr:YdcF family protein [Bacteroidia bacterium]